MTARKRECNHRRYTGKSLCTISRHVYGMSHGELANDGSYMWQSCIDGLIYAAGARAFAGRCEQFVLCSSAVVYGGKMPASVLIDERAPLEPTSYWGKSKVACEQTLLRAAENGAFKLTIARLGHTYGPGDFMNDQQDNDGFAWDRVLRGLPVFCAGDGLGLWQSTHRDDVAKFFAFAALASQTYGQAFNVMRDEILTWRDYYREVARALDRKAQLIFVPASWLIAQNAGTLQFSR